LLQFTMCKLAGMAATGEAGGGVPAIDLTLAVPRQR